MLARTLRNFSSGVFLRIIRIDTVILELSVQRRASNAELSSHLAHLPAVEFQRETNQFFLDIGQFANLARRPGAGNQIVGDERFGWLMVLMGVRFAV